MAHVAELPPLPPRERQLFCNRTLNLRSVRAIGFDMDYTLVHYRAEEWERRAYEYARQRLAERGWPVEGFLFDPSFVSLGLVLDLELGNIVKATRFGYVTRACHGTRMLEFDEQRRHYSRVLVDLSEPRWVFLNTLFSLSEASLYAQAVELLDAGRLESAVGYADLYRIVKQSLDSAHMEGKLKEEISLSPERFVVLDPDLPLALLDLKNAGKQLLVITNSEWSYTSAMMTYCFDRYLPDKVSWRDLFDLVVVSARKPDFFTVRSPVFEVVDEGGLLRPFTGKLEQKGIYLGGHAGLVERDLGLLPEDILYIGDHVYADVSVTKSMLRWRTALVLRALEDELRAVEAFEPKQHALSHLMAQKAEIEHGLSLLRLQNQRAELGYGPKPELPVEVIRRRIHELRGRLAQLDDRIAPLAREANELCNLRWGPLMRAGNDKSHLARQIERYADVYTSRVSNLLAVTPFVYLRAPRGSLPHDPLGDALDTGEA